MYAFERIVEVNVYKYLSATSYHSESPKGKFAAIANRFNLVVAVDITQHLVDLKPF